MDVVRRLIRRYQQLQIDTLNAAASQRPRFFVGTEPAGGETYSWPVGTSNASNRSLRGRGTLHVHDPLGRLTNIIFNVLSTAEIVVGVPALEDGAQNGHRAVHAKDD